jgi:hypothetical protein
MHLAFSLEFLSQTPHSLTIRLGQLGYVPCTGCNNFFLCRKSSPQSPKNFTSTQYNPTVKLIAKVSLFDVCCNTKKIRRVRQRLGAASVSAPRRVALEFHQRLDSCMPRAVCNFVFHLYLRTSVPPPLRRHHHTLATLLCPPLTNKFKPITQTF